MVLLTSMSVIGLIETLQYRTYIRKNHDRLKQSLFRYSIDDPKNNLVDVFLHDEQEMQMLDNDTNPYDEPDVTYYDYFITYRK